METIQQPMDQSKKIYPWKEYSKKYDKKKKKNVLDSLLNNQPKKRSLTS